METLIAEIVRKLYSLFEVNVLVRSLSPDF
jgi:hypothetical protein